MTAPIAIDIDGLAVVKGGKQICQVGKLSVSAGERLAVMGPNGSGKTTLLKVLAGVQQTDGGRCRVAAAPRERVLVHQSPVLFRGTVEFNVGYGLAARRIPVPQRKQMIECWLTRLGITKLQGRTGHNLSGGERRRVALARAFALYPELLLLDEPFADLDETGIDHVCDAIESVTTSTILLTSPTPLPTRLRTRVLQMG